MSITGCDLLSAGMGSAFSAPVLSSGRNVGYPRTAPGSRTILGDRKATDRAEHFGWESRRRLGSLRNLSSLPEPLASKIGPDYLRYDIPSWGAEL